jgi:nucleotide-binding universal stress UspA family protein
MKILIAADGSPYTRAAAQYVANHAGMLKEPPEVRLIHVHAALPYTKSVSKQAIDAYYKEESVAALEVAEKELAKAGVKFTSTWATGDAAQQIAKYAKSEGMDLIVTGTRGHGALAAIAMGSVTTKLLALSSVPVLVIPTAKG